MRGRGCVDGQHARGTAAQATRGNTALLTTCKRARKPPAGEGDAGQEQTRGEEDHAWRPGLHGSYWRPAVHGGVASAHKRSTKSTVRPPMGYGSGCTHTRGGLAQAAHATHSSAVNQGHGAAAHWPSAPPQRAETKIRRCLAAKETREEAQLGSAQTAGGGSPRAQTACETPRNQPNPGAINRGSGPAAIGWSWAGKGCADGWRQRWHTTARTMRLAPGNAAVCVCVCVCVCCCCCCCMGCTADVV